MTNRPPQHATADAAADAVRAAFVRSGHAVDEIKRDYGEDLLVQTAVRGRVDPCRLWIQVKGTSNLASHRRASGDYVVRVSIGHIKKWISLTDLMVVVLWDVVSWRGFWTLPRRELGWADAQPGAQHLRLVVSAQHTLDARAVERLTWEARFESYATRIAQIIVGESFNPVPATLEFPQAFLIPEWSRHLVVSDLLLDMGVCADDRIALPYAAVWREAWNSLTNHDPLERHVTASTRMFDTAVRALAPGLKYPPHLLTAVLLMLLATVRPGRALDVGGCDWTGVPDDAFDGDDGPITLFDHGELKIIGSPGQV